MTGNTNHPGERRRGAITPSYGPQEIFGSLNFRSAQTERGLPTTDSPIDVTQTAQARSFWGDVAKKIVEWTGEKTAEIGRDILKGYPRTAYARTGSPYASSVYGETPSLSGLEVGGYRPRPAKQSWLQRITDNIGRYVYGAAVPEGNEKGIYVDESLLEKAKKYSKRFAQGFRETASEYAGHFIEALKTAFHEYGHLFEGIRNEGSAEDYATGIVERLADVHDSVRFALDVYRSKLQPLAVQNRRVV